MRVDELEQAVPLDAFLVAAAQNFLAQSGKRQKQDLKTTLLFRS